MPSTDTIAAIATARGVGGVSLVRVSGPGADGILRAVAPELGPFPEPRRAAVARIVSPASGEEVDRGLVTRFPGPASYTGEDVVEISGHGGWLAPALVLEACVDAGARLAEPGEFTRRAYLNGKLDLVQVEAVADLVEARSRAMHRASLVQLDRGLSLRVSQARDALVGLEAYLAHHLDFPEEDEAPASREEVADRAQRVVELLDELLTTAPAGALLREGAVVVLAGPPNSGKSSLYNALVGEDRALVTEIPGTTRDALESSVEIGGYPFRLMDTAGLRDTPETVERMGIEVARRALARADVVLFCAEGGRLDPRAREFVGGLGVPVVVLETKADLGVAEAGEVEGLNVAAVVAVSAHTGMGLGELKRVLTRLVFEGLVQAGESAPVLTRERQVRAVAGAREEIACFQLALREGVPAEIAATHLQTAAGQLEDMLGVITVDDVLDVVFGTFCIGK